MEDIPVAEGQEAGILQVVVLIVALLVADILEVEVQAAGILQVEVLAEEVPRKRVLAAEVAPLPELPLTSARLGALYWPRLTGPRDRP